MEQIQSNDQRINRQNQKSAVKKIRSLTVPKFDSSKSDVSDKIDSKKEAVEFQVKSSEKSSNDKYSINRKMQAMVANLCDSSLEGSVISKKSNKETSLNEEIFAKICKLLIDN